MSEWKCLVDPKGASDLELEQLFARVEISRGREANKREAPERGENDIPFPARIVSRSCCAEPVNNRLPSTIENPLIIVRA